jgi:hypothetical protein
MRLVPFSPRRSPRTLELNNFLLLSRARVKPDAGPENPRGFSATRPPRCYVNLRSILLRGDARRGILATAATQRPGRRLASSGGPASRRTGVGPPHKGERPKEPELAAA